MATLLSELGVACGHEHAIQPLSTWLGVLAWYEAAEHGESSWMGWTVAAGLPGRVPVLHVIRNPWDVIDSLANRNAILNRDGTDAGLGRVREVIRAYVPDVFEWHKKIDRAAALVVRWNRLIHERCPWSVPFRVEDLDVGSMRHLLAHIGAERTREEIARAVAKIPPRINSGTIAARQHDPDDPAVAEIVDRYATQPNCRVMSLERTDSEPTRPTPEQVAALVDPVLLESVNHWAAECQYPEARCRASCGSQP